MRMREKASEMLPLYSLDFLLHPASMFPNGARDGGAA
jgi:hypothetical protein